MASLSTQQMHGTQGQATGTPSPRHTMEARPSHTVMTTQSQDPYPPRSPSVASRMFQMLYEKMTFLARARATTKALLRRRALPAHPESDPPPTIHTPLPQLLPIISPNKEWSSRLGEIPHTTAPLASSLLGLDPQAQMETFPAPIPPVAPSR
ncbi:uncharacterized protein ARMOST_00590 [Armillaria ostoyae]|uniref:Uncharacterized protein n=1 Tax=Armillaria ostoyae TaxID=47428 RepID=A0A284QLM0_ARMOS|nr:uncharacterized protein ARMOST_00590 [Armillaria ostoyae]